MPLASCPTCSTALRVPDGPAAAVRCPKCKSVFAPAGGGPPAPTTAPALHKPPPPPARPAFGSGVTPAGPRSAPAVRVSPKTMAPRPAPAPVVAPPPVAPPPARRPAPPPPPPPEDEFDFEIVADEPPPPAKPKKAVLIEDDDRPRVARRVDDDDEDDRPRSKAKGRRRDDDEDEDRPGSRRSREDDDEDDRPRRRGGRGDRDRRQARRRRAGSGVGPARTGLLLLHISLWCYAGTLLALTFFLLLLWVGVVVPYGLIVLPGLSGLANWVLALVGLGFALAGPARARGLAVGATVAAAVHLALLFTGAVSKGEGRADLGVFRTAAASAGMNKMVRIGERLRANPNDQAAIQEAQEAMQEAMRDADRAGSGGWGGSSIHWEQFGTALPALEGLPGLLIYSSKSLEYGEVVVGLLAGAAELARLVLILLAVKALARDRDVDQSADTGVMAALGAVGAIALVTLLVQVIVRETKFEGFRTPMNLFFGVSVIGYMAHVGMLLPGVRATQQAHGAVGDGPADDGY